MNVKQGFQISTVSRATFEWADLGRVECECMLCDEPAKHDDMEVKWRLAWRFDRAPAIEFGEATMLLCDHCLNDWLDHPDDFGGDCVGFHAV